MGFFDRFGGNNIPTTQKETNVQLTELGKEKLEKGQITGKEFDVAATVKKLEPCTPSEVAQDMHYPENKVRFLLNSLKARQWLQVMK